jgi:HSP20 family protein
LKSYEDGKEKTMMELTLWKNQQISILKSDMDRLFDRWWSLLAGGSAGQSFPSIDAVEGKDALIIKAEVPGYHPDEIEITVSGDELTILGKRTMERISGDLGAGRSTVKSFSRTLRLPCSVDSEKIAALYQEGVLTIKMPKKSSAGRRRIEIAIK